MLIDRRKYVLAFAFCTTWALSSGELKAEDLCRDYGPQAPRDISVKSGANPISFKSAPASSEMNLCDIHFHVNAEHKGPDFEIFAGPTERGGYQCNSTTTLTDAERAPRAGGCKGLNPGDTIEVHWVYTTCTSVPGPGLGTCLTDTCTNPQLRVESQIFLAVNDPTADNFADYTYGGNVVDGLHQAKSLPTGTGAPVEFAGSTTGPKFTKAVCSPFQVTWRGRPQCAKVNIKSVDAWCADNVFQEDHAHGVRQLVTSPELLSKFK